MTTATTTRTITRTTTYATKQASADLDENGSVDFGDVLVVLMAWGSC